MHSCVGTSQKKAKKNVHVRRRNARKTIVATVHKVAAATVNVMHFLASSSLVSLFFFSVLYAVRGLDSMGVTTRGVRARKLVRSRSFLSVRIDGDDATEMSRRCWSLVVDPRRVSGSRSVDTEVLREVDSPLASRDDTRRRGDASPVVAPLASSSNCSICRCGANVTLGLRGALCHGGSRAWSAVFRARTTRSVADVGLTDPVRFVFLLLLAAMTSVAGSHSPSSSSEPTVLSSSVSVSSTPAPAPLAAVGLSSGGGGAAFRNDECT